MSQTDSTRRQFLKAAGATVAALGIPSARAADAANAIVVDPKPRFELSPYLYMQFIEPLGTTDGSVAAAWDFGRDCWRPDVIDVTRRLAPSMMRWGGCFSSYYRWKEAVGPRDKRVPMLNMCWGGIDTNQIGTVEFVDFCRQVEAEPLMCVNFESDGRKYWEKDPKGSVRSAGPEEAAEWVRYCNDPDDKLRRSHGIEKPCPMHMWQLGNETSYDRNAYDCETAARRTIAFAKAMRQADPDLTLIGWGDSGGAREVYVRAARPPLIFPCRFNLSTRSIDELGARKAIRRIEGHDIGDVSQYIEPGSAKHERMVEAVGQTRDKLCLYCGRASAPKPPAAKLRLTSPKPRSPAPGVEPPGTIRPNPSCSSIVAYVSC